MAPVLKDQAGEIIRKAAEYITGQSPSDYFIKVGLTGPNGIVPAVPIAPTDEVPGTTTQYSGTVGTSPINIPATAGTEILDALVRCETDNTPMNKRLLVSFDSGTTFMKLSPGEFVGWSIKGGLTQLVIKGNVANVVYEVILNRKL